MIQVYQLAEYIDLWHDVADVYYTIPYLQAAALHEEGEIVVCIYRQPGGAVFYPFVLRPLSGACYDIVTPYEYGGPLVYATDRAAVQAGFQKAFASYCHSQGIVSEFVRFHPLLCNQRGWGELYELQKCRDNVVIDLSKELTTIFAEYRNSTRYNVRMARKGGVQIERADKTLASFRLFVDLYHRTMVRVNAAPFYYFSNEYFEGLANLSDDLISLYFARDCDGRIISAALFLHGQRYVHYHLSATVTGVNRLAPNNLLLHTVAIDMQRAGKKYLHLGGAAPDQVGLFRFKSGFSSDRRAYYVGRRIHDPVKYEALWVEAGQPVTDYFPAYRYER